MTQILNRTSEYLTGPWQDSVVHYSREICQRLHSADYNSKEVQSLIRMTFEFKMCPWLSFDFTVGQNDQVQRLVSQLYLL